LLLDSVFTIDPVFSKYQAKLLSPA
jgi:hypothetical protein